MRVERTPAGRNLPPYRVVIQDGYVYCETEQAAIREARAYCGPNDVIDLPERPTKPERFQSAAMRGAASAVAREQANIREAFGMARIKVEQSNEKPVEKGVLAEAIVKIGDAADALNKSGLNEEAIVILLHAKCGVSKVDIRKVLNGLRQLRGWYCR